MRGLNIAILVFENINPFLLSVPCTVFGENRQIKNYPNHRLILCAEKKSPIKTSLGLTLNEVKTLRAMQSADVIIVPSWHDPDQRPSNVICQALQKAYQRGAIVLGLCLGAYVLAAAGLLNRKRATTHWAWASHFQSQYPQVKVDAEVLYIADQRVWTSAGSAAALDCCLHFVAQHYGMSVASMIARYLVVPLHRAGNQAQYVTQPLPTNNRSHHFSNLLDWIQENLHLTHNLDDLAARAAMSRRTFTRHFQIALGQPFYDWLQQQRIQLAQRLLETSDLTVEHIAEKTGFRTALSLRQLFKRKLKLTPKQYLLAFKHQI